MSVNNSVNAEKHILDVYQKHQAKLIDAHGVLTGTKEIVPPDTVLMFLSEPGYCMLLAAGRSVARDFFQSKSNLIKFFKSGNNRRNYKHVSDILKRTHFEGEQYLDLSLEMKDPGIKGLGFIKKLPLRRQQYVSNYQYKHDITPTFAETTGPLFHGKNVKLSSVLKLGGPGVYIVSACRVSQFESKKPENKLPTNLPHKSSWPYMSPVYRARRGVISNLIRSIPRKKSKPGIKKVLKIPHPRTKNYPIIAELATLKKYSQPKSLSNKIKNVLVHMSREHPISVRNVLTRKSSNKKMIASTTNQIRPFIAPLPANTNVTNLKFTLGILQNKNKVGTLFRTLPLRQQFVFLTQPLKRGELIYELLKK